MISDNNPIAAAKAQSGLNYRRAIGSAREGANPGQAASEFPLVSLVFPPPQKVSTFSLSFEKFL